MISKEWILIEIIILYIKAANEWEVGKEKISWEWLWKYPNSSFFELKRVYTSFTFSAVKNEKWKMKNINNIYLWKKKCWRLEPLNLSVIDWESSILAKLEHEPQRKSSSRRQLQSWRTCAEVWSNILRADRQLALNAT